VFVGHRRQTTHCLARGNRPKTEILKEIWDCAKKELNSEELYNELLLAKFEGNKTAWHVSALMGNAGILENLWEWAKEIQTQTR